MTAAAPAPRSYDDAAARITHGFSALSPQYQAVGRFLLDHPDEVAVLSMRSVAARVAAQPATLVRFAQSLGFSGWPDLRALCVQRLRGRPDPYAARARSIVQSGGATDLIGHLFDEQRANLDSNRALNRDTLERAVALLNDARTVHVAGFRSCHSVAFAFYYVYRLFRPSVVLLTGEGGTLEMQLQAIQPGDTTLVISFAPYSREARLVADAAAQAGSRVVALSDSVVAPFAAKADACVTFRTSSPSFFPSVVGIMALVECLLQMLVSKGGEGVAERLEKVEERLYASGAYDPPAAETPRRRRPSRT